MVKEKEITREEAKLGITPLVKHDKKIAENTHQNVIPNIPGAYIAIFWVGGKPYYRLQKTYYYKGHRVTRTLLYYGIRPPRAK